MANQDDDQKSSLKACLEENNNPRMQNYVKILDTPNISAFEWIHRTQEELMDGIVYLEKLKDTLSENMRELDAAREIPPEKKEEATNIDVNVEPADVPPTPKKRKPRLKLKIPEDSQSPSTPIQEEMKKPPGAPRRKTRAKKATEETTV